MWLAEAGDGHSLDPTHWETMPQPPQHIPPSSTLSMDLPFSLRELDHALGSMHPRKAPGDDGITTALMQAIAYDPKDYGTGDVNLDRPGALALLRVANTIFLSGAIPKVWRKRKITRIITSLDATIVKSFKAWIPRSKAAEKDKLAAISSFAAKTVTTIQRSPDVKARNFFRSLLASIGGRPLKTATAEATKIRAQTLGFSISTMEIIPKESLPVKTATDKEPATPAVDSPSDMAAEITPAIQVDGATPTVTPIADVEMCL
ncbi:hypothetical protein BASA50_008672 [Batrachochytrium salamandrivorans]|uniref:Uncharacterized protein n=1 Tax=Batrachochytrium salamandrivorans TaxID=1357716 RepID=A0ABQ8F3G0_9FUNG|nr:hypothetical protein BASA50_008672 [Batrachochytrium salamandrivorans]